MSAFENEKCLNCKMLPDCFGGCPLYKCKNKIKEIIAAGTTVLYVSHSANSVKEICPRSIFLKKGTIIFDGPTEETLKVYEDSKKKK